MEVSDNIWKKPTERRIEELENKLAVAMEERDCAMEMWQLTKQVVEKAQTEVPFEIKKELEDVKREYSEAIQLLENKCCQMESLLQNSLQENNKLTGKIAELTNKISQMQRESENSELVIKTMDKEKVSLKTSLEQTKEMLKVADQVSIQARSKVADALSMAQDALGNEASIAEEKAQLEEEMANQMINYESKIAQEVDKIRSELSSKIEALSYQLHTVTLERNRFSHEVESLKSECRIAEKQFSIYNKNLGKELDDVRNKRQHESTIWYDERGSLRRQVTTLQGEVETLLAQLQKAQGPCSDCEEFRAQTERYKRLALKWEDAADRVTTDFERYVREAKEQYYLQPLEEQPGHKGEPA